jgi:hypothetical protein
MTAARGPSGGAGVTVGMGVGETSPPLPEGPGQAPGGPLTCGDREAALWALGWSPGQLARLLGYSTGTVKRWLAEPAALVPPEVDAWLGRMAAVLDADPPPVRMRRRLMRSRLD